MQHIKQAFLGVLLAGLALGPASALGSYSPSTGGSTVNVQTFNAGDANGLRVTTPSGMYAWRLDALPTLAGTDKSEPGDLIAAR